MNWDLHKSGITSGGDICGFQNKSETSAYESRPENISLHTSRYRTFTVNGLLPQHFYLSCRDLDSCIDCKEENRRVWNRTHWRESEPYSVNTCFRSALFSAGTWFIWILQLVVQECFVQFVFRDFAKTKIMTSVLLYVCVTNFLPRGEVESRRESWTVTA